MRKLSSVALVSSSLIGCLILAQGCSGSKATVPFEEPNTVATDKKDAGAGDAAPEADNTDPGQGFADDAGDGGSLIEDGSACATATATTHRDPVYLLFVVDGSGSMGSDMKWVSQTLALDAWHVSRRLR